MVLFHECVKPIAASINPSLTNDTGAERGGEACAATSVIPQIPAPITIVSVDKR